MAGFPEEFFKDPENNQIHLIQLVKNYAQHVPQLLPSLRDVINYGMLYDQKLKAFLKMMAQERKRQRRLSGNDGYETDLVDYPENVSICSADTRDSSPVKKKKKKKLKEPSPSTLIEAEGAIITDERIGTNIVAVNLEHTENVHSDGSQAKKKRKKTSQIQDCNLSESATSHPPNGLSKVSNVPGVSGSSSPSNVDLKQLVKMDVDSYEEMKLEIEVKGDPHAENEEDPLAATPKEESILLNIVGGNENESQHNPISASPDKSTGRKILEPGASPSGATPFRVIPSVQLMEDPARFPELDPRPGEHSETSSSPVKKWRVTFEFGSPAVGSRRLTTADVCTVLEQFGLKNVRVLLMINSQSGTYSVLAEFFSTDSFQEVFQSSEGAPKVIDVQTCAETDAAEDNSELNGCVVDSPTGPKEERTEQPNFQMKLFRQLINPSTVDWIKESLGRGDRRLFKEWLDLQKRSLPTSSPHDDGNVLFKSPQHWANAFRKWAEDHRVMNAGNQSLLKSNGADSSGNPSETTPSEVAPSPRNLQSMSSADSPSVQHNGRGASGNLPQRRPVSHRYASSSNGRGSATPLMQPHYNRESTSSDTGRGSSTPPTRQPRYDFQNTSSTRTSNERGSATPPRQSHYNHDNTSSDTRREAVASPTTPFYSGRTSASTGRDSQRPQPLQNSVNWRLLKVLKEQTEHYRTACVNSRQVNDLMHERLSVDEHQQFIRWLNDQKEQIIKNPRCIPTHVLFRSPSSWFKEFMKSRGLSQMRPNYRRRNSRGGRGRKVGMH